MGRVGLIRLVALVGLAAVSGFCAAAEVAGSLQGGSRRALRGGVYDCIDLAGYEQCGDIEGAWYDACCPDGQYCTQQPGNPHYWQCVPPGHYGKKDVGHHKDAGHNLHKKDAGRKDSRMNALSDYCYELAEYEQCGDIDGEWDGFCCPSAQSCTEQPGNPHYWQCVPPGHYGRKDVGHHKKDAGHNSHKKDAGRKDSRMNALSYDCYELAEYEQCGDIDGEWDGFCCPSAQSCTEQPGNPYYWQCVPPGHYGKKDVGHHVKDAGHNLHKKDAGRKDSHMKASSGCYELAEYEQCGGIEGEWHDSCCPKGQYCTEQPGNPHYWQCVPPGHYGKKDVGHHKKDASHNLHKKDAGVKASRQG